MVYLIYCSYTNLVKIGYAKNPERRLKQLQTGSAYPLIILKTIPNATKRLEKELHFKFRHYKLEGEWFKFVDCMIQEFDRLLPYFHLKNN